MLEYGVVSSNVRNDLYAEILCDGVQCAEIYIVDRENMKINIKTFSGTDFDVDCDTFLSIVLAAKKRLLEVEGLI